MIPKLYFQYNPLLYSSRIKSSGKREKERPWAQEINCPSFLNWKISSSLRAIRQYLKLKQLRNEGKYRRSEKTHFFNIYATRHCADADTSVSYTAFVHHKHRLNSTSKCFDCRYDARSRIMFEKNRSIFFIEMVSQSSIWLHATTSPPSLLSLKTIATLTIYSTPWDVEKKAKEKKVHDKTVEFVFCSFSIFFLVVRLSLFSFSSISAVRSALFYDTLICECFLRHFHHFQICINAFLPRSDCFSLSLLLSCIVLLTAH